MSIGHTPNAAKFCRDPTRNVQDISCLSKICAPEKVDQSSLKSLKTCYAPMPLIAQNFIALGHTMYGKRVTIFVHPSVFWRPRGELPESKFTNLGPDVQGSLYQCAKFRPVLTTHLRDIYCQISSISSISLTALPTKTVNDTSPHIPRGVKCISE